MSQSMSSNRVQEDEPLVKLEKVDKVNGINTYKILVLACPKEPVDICEFTSGMSDEKIIEEVGRVCEHD